MSYEAISKILLLSNELQARTTNEKAIETITNLKDFVKSVANETGIQVEEEHNGTKLSALSDYDLLVKIRAEAEKLEGKDNEEDKDNDSIAKMLCTKIIQVYGFDQEEALADSWSVFFSPYGRPK
ncbi:hypothetical protein [Peribacillus deserti]|uniref:Uncharacterized protein n=1 Tax=Peribacillus deserti TaxID=673318 RepID=A0A2N5M632_9BACI|nr:hypothetical protein [Peribacillus deserti]PLT29805.1 hypothetical protein CUU66_10905 [Peribacillus deserti]